MKRYKHLFFDFDGTLCNTFEGIEEILDLMFEHYGMSVPKENYPRYIGPPLSETFVSLMNGDRTRAYEAVAYFGKLYVERNALYKTVLYDGIADTLRRLQALGFRVHVASCKKQEDAEALLRFFGISQTIDFVSGLCYNVRETKREVLEYAMRQLGARVEECVMIGDTVYDADGAQALGMDCILCLWGFGDYPKIENQNIVFRAADIGQAEAYLIESAE